MILRPKELFLNRVKYLSILNYQVGKKICFHLRLVPTYRFVLSAVTRRRRRRC